MANNQCPAGQTKIQYTKIAGSSIKTYVEGENTLKVVGLDNVTLQCKGSAGNDTHPEAAPGVWEKLKPLDPWHSADDQTIDSKDKKYGFCVANPSPISEICPAPTPALKPKASGEKAKAPAQLRH